MRRLTLRGELDIATAPTLRQEFETAMNEEAVEMIVLDLTELAFLDSSGLRLLLEMSAAAQDADRLRIVNGSPAVQRLFDLAGVRPLLPIVTSTDNPFAPL